AGYLKHKADEIGAAKGDPKKVFGRQVAARLPDTDAVDFCAARIHAANSCGNFLRINRVYALDSQVTEQEAQVTGEIEMAVLARWSVLENFVGGELKMSTNLSPDSSASSIFWPVRSLPAFCA